MTVQRNEYIHEDKNVDDLKIMNFNVFNHYILIAFPVKLLNEFHKPYIFSMFFSFFPQLSGKQEQNPPLPTSPS